MEKHYFIGEGPEAEKIIAETLERDEISKNARRTLAADYGANGLILGGWNNESVVGLGFKEKTDAPFLKGGEKVHGGYAYFPKCNTKAGKELSKRLDDERLKFNPSDFIFDAIGTHWVAIEDRKLFESVAGLSKDMKKILVIIPRTKEKSRGCSNQFPSMPKWLREVIESEFIAAQGK